MIAMKPLTGDLTDRVSSAAKQVGVVRPAPVAAAPTPSPAAQTPNVRLAGQYPVQTPPTPPAPAAPSVSPLMQQPSSMTGTTISAPRPPMTAAPAVQPRPAVQAPPPQQAPAGAEIHTINPAADLRSAQITPADSGRTAVTKGFTNQAAAGVANAPSVSQDAGTLRSALFKELNPQDLAAGPAINPTRDPRTLAAQGQYDQALGTVAGGIQQGTASQIADARYGTLANQLGAGKLAAQTDPSRLTAMSGGTDIAAQTGPSSIKGGPSIDPVTGARLAANTSLADRAAQAVGTGPSRSDIAKQQLQAYDLEHANDLRNNTRAVGQSAAKFGRLGQGATEQAVTQTLADMERQRRAEELRLAASTAEGDITDRLSNLNALQGYQGQNFTQDQSLRGEQRAERDYSTGLEETNVGMQRADAANLQAVLAANLERRRADALNQQGVAAQNIGYGREDAANRQAVEARNLDADQAARAQATQLASTQGQNAVSDRFQALSQLGGAQQTAYAQNAADQEAARGERGYQDQWRQYNQGNDIQAQQYAASMGQSLAGANADQRFQALGAAQGLEAQQVGQDANTRAELRGERGYQTEQANNATDRRIQQQVLEDQLYGNQFNRDLALGEFGYGGNPGAMTAQIGQDYAADAQGSFSTAAELMRQQQLQAYLAKMGIAA
jgi:hypothetical protein